jgi:divalent metal cation (Fe/Co/Zn/Cd) transporter
MSGKLKRAGHVLAALIYGALAVSAVRVLLNRSEQGNAEQTWTARLLQQPFGKFLLGAIGLAVIGYGLQQIWRAYNADFRKRLNLSELRADQAHWAVQIGRFGHAARGVVLGLVGMFLLQAALQSNPSSAGGLDQALQLLAQQRYGQLLLGIAAAGLIAYGVSMFVEARYRRIAVDNTTLRSPSLH